MSGFRRQEKSGEGSNGEKDPKDKTFSIELVGEALFAVNAPAAISDADLSDDVVMHLLAQVHPLVIFRARTCAAEMGFSGVRPTLGFERQRITIASAETQQPEPKSE